MAWALIATWVHIQILLVVRLSIPPLSRGQDLCGNATLPPLLVDLLCDLLGNLLLLIVVVEDSAAILGADIRALPVLGRGIVHLVEEFEERAVFDLGGVVYYLEGFGVYGGVSTIPYRSCTRLRPMRLCGNCCALRAHE